MSYKAGHLGRRRTHWVRKLGATSALLLTILLLAMPVADAGPTTLTTQAAPGTVPVGQQIFDLASVSGVTSTAGGTVTFTLYGPSLSGPPGCMGNPTFTSTVTASIGGNISSLLAFGATSQFFTAALPGTYQWVAVYSGDAGNSGSNTPCDDPAEQISVLAQPTIATSPSPTDLGQPMSDTATLSDGVDLSGTVLFQLYNDTNDSCMDSDNLPVYTDTEDVGADPVISSGSYTPTSAGIYDWIATYSGDANNGSATSGCGNETVTVLAEPSITTAAAQATAALGASVSDTATLTGSASCTQCDPPTPAGGTITFSLYAPTDPSCASSPVFTSTATVSGDDTYPSDSFVTAAAGVYHWVAVYSGDSLNETESTTCGDANESVAVTPAQATIRTAAAAATVTVGSGTSDTSTLVGAFQPSGTMTFNLYGPANANCTAPPAFHSTSTVTGSVTTSATFAPPSPGTYLWVASYSGDQNNSPVVATCGALNETVKVVQATPGLTTTAVGDNPLGSPIQDTARVTAGDNPGGTITFDVFGPNDSTGCSRSPISVSTVAVRGDGAYLSALFLPSSEGRYDYVATYSGDVNNTPVANTCRSPGESVTITPAEIPGPVTTTLPPVTTTLPPVTTTLPPTASATTAPTTSTTVPPTTPTTARPPNTSTTTVPPAATVPPSTTTARPSNTTTTVPPTTATTARPRATSSAVGPTVPSGSTPPTVPSGSPAPTVPQTVPPPSVAPTSPSIAPPTVPRTVLQLTSLVGHPFSPPGAGVKVAVSGLPSSCRTAYFFFDGTQIGSGAVAHHRSGEGSISVPGDASVGNHHVTVACKESGGPVLASFNYRILSSSVHRSEFLTSLNQPRQITLTLHSLLLSALLAVALFLLLAFPAQIFNSTLQEHYEEVRAWFHLSRPLSEVVDNADQRIMFPFFILTGGVLYALLDPGFGFNLSTLALALGLAAAVAVTTVGFGLPAFLFFGIKLRDRGQVLVLPGTLLIGGIFVLVSRLLGFQPGYLYGVLALFVFHHEIEEKTQGKLAAASALIIIGLAYLAWWARVPLAGATMKATSFWGIVLETALGGAFVIGLESTVVGLLPMRFLDGNRIRAWSKSVWLAMFILAVFTVIAVLVQPGTGYVGHSSELGRISVLALYMAFAILSVAFWAYFRFRPPRDAAEPDEGDLEAEGDFDVR